MGTCFLRRYILYWTLSPVFHKLDPHGALILQQDLDVFRTVFCGSSSPALLKERAGGCPQMFQVGLDLTKLFLVEPDQLVTLVQTLLHELAAVSDIRHHIIPLVLCRKDAQHIRLCYPQVLLLPVS